jgi:putative FmdB family regulatory protein
MPFYEYECSACGHYLEAMQKISDAPLRKCPACGRQKLARLMSAPVFRLKGAGWYETDFKSDEEGKRNLAEHPEKEKEAEPAQETATADAAKPAEKASESSDKAATPAPTSGAAEPAAKSVKPRTAAKRKPRKTPSAKTSAAASARRRASGR